MVKHEGGCHTHPDGVSVNARCLDPDTTESMTVKHFDGRHWEKHYPSGRARGYPE